VTDDDDDYDDDDGNYDAVVVCISSPFLKNSDAGKETIRFALSPVADICHLSLLTFEVTANEPHKHKTKYFWIYQLCSCANTKGNKKQQKYLNDTRECGSEFHYHRLLLLRRRRRRQHKCFHLAVVCKYVTTTGLLLL